MKPRIVRLLLLILTALVFTALTEIHMETRGTFHWGYEVLTCTLMSLGVSVNLYFNSPDKSRRAHLAKAFLSIGTLWFSYLLFEEALMHYTFLQFSVAYQFISPFLVLALYFFTIKFFYSLKRVVLAVIVTETILCIDLVASFFADTMDELYYPASLVFVIIFVYPLVVRFKSGQKADAAFSDGKPRGDFPD